MSLKPHWEEMKYHTNSLINKIVKKTNYLDRDAPFLPRYQRTERELQIFPDSML